MIGDYRHNLNIFDRLKIKYIPLIKKKTLHTKEYNNIYELYNRLYEEHIIDINQLCEYVDTLNNFEHFKDKLAKDMLDVFVKSKDNPLFPNGDIWKEFQE